MYNFPKIDCSGLKKKTKTADWTLFKYSPETHYIEGTIYYPTFINKPGERNSNFTTRMSFIPSYFFGCQCHRGKTL